MAIAEREMQNRPVRKKDIHRLTLEDTLHHRRVVIKGLLARVDMLRTLAETDHMARNDFTAARQHIFLEINHLGHLQRATRRDLNEHQKATKSSETIFPKPTSSPTGWQRVGAIKDLLENLHERKKAGLIRGEEFVKEHTVLVTKLNLARANTTRA